jgi:hypothetical protein
MQVDRPAWRRAVVQPLVRHVAREGLARQIDQRGAREAAKRVGLRGPVEIAERTREAAEVVLGRLVVAQG